MSSQPRRRADLVGRAVLCFLSVSLYVLGGATVAAQSSPWLPGGHEVSEDGRLAVTVGAAALPISMPGPAETRAALAFTPFGTAPDWSSTARRQVGGLQLADIDGNGWLDIVVGCYNSNSFPPYTDWHNFIHFNGPTGIETTPSWVSADQVSTGEVQVADFNGDTFLDVLSANGGASYSPSVIYFGAAGGVLSTTAGWTSGDVTWTTNALAYDIDHDTDLDLITTNQGNSQNDPFRPIHVFYNGGSGLETVPSWSSAEISIQSHVDFGDFDGDGWEDMAVSKWANFETAIYKNVAGTLQTTPIWTIGDTNTDKGVGWADVDDDGDLDLAVGRGPTLLLDKSMTGLAPIWSSTAAFFGHQDMEWLDVDLDGDPDLAEIHFSNGVVNIYENVGGVLSTAPSWSWDDSAVGNVIAFGDLNNDGFPDLVAGFSGDEPIRVFFHTGVNEVFVDGFESGDLSAWSSVVTP